MKFVVFFLGILLITECVRAQNVFSVAIEADNHQPFSVSVGDKNYSSSPLGDLLISNLSNATYKVVINFQGGIIPVQVFGISINNKNIEYLLKKIDEKNWGLIDKNSQEILKSLLMESHLNVKTENIFERNNDGFAKMMAAVVNDSAVLFIEVYKPPVQLKNAEKKKEVALDTIKQLPALTIEKSKKVDSQALVSNNSQKNTLDTLTKKAVPNQLKNSIVTKLENPSVKGKSNAGKEVIKNRKEDSLIIVAVGNKKRVTDSLSLKGKELQKKPINKESVSDLSKERSSLITPTGERLTSTSRELFFTDNNNGKISDTINVIIDFDEKVIIGKKYLLDSAGVIEKPFEAKKQDSVLREEEKLELPTEKKKKDSSIVTAPLIKLNNLDTGKNDSKEIPVKKLAIINSDCKNFASDLDLDKLRMKMLAESNLDERIVLAKKVFRTRCFTTKQIKALTELFVNDKTRYAFFDAAYPFVSDSENFKALVELLNEEYYITRFKVMVRM